MSDSLHLKCDMRYINGNGVVINGTDVSTWGGGRRDTIAHELGHNMDLDFWMSEVLPAIQTL